MCFYISWISWLHSSNLESLLKHRAKKASHKDNHRTKHIKAVSSMKHACLVHTTHTDTNTSMVKREIDKGEGKGEWGK